MTLLFLLSDSPTAAHEEVKPGGLFLTCQLSENARQVGKLRDPSGLYATLEHLTSLVCCTYILYHFAW